jgi:hypothetical protein
MTAPTPKPDELTRWKAAGSSRIPFWVYTDEQLHKSLVQRGMSLSGWRISNQE